MAPYPANNFYDPVGSQSNQPSGYTYANANNNQYASQNSAYQSNSYTHNYGSGYDNQYATTGQQAQSSANTDTAAAGLSSLSSHTYSQPAASNTSRSNVAYDTSNSTWGTPNYASNTYSSATSRTTANQSPIYATQSSGSTFGRSSLPDQSHSSSNSFAASQNYQTASTTPAAPSSGSGSGSRSYKNAPNSAGYKSSYQPPSQQTQQPPPRYASPLHAMQAQQHQQHQQHPGHSKQPSQTSNQMQPSPRVAAQNMQQQRQQSVSVEPMPTTVDPSQVYDIRAEREKAARIEAERRRKVEAEQAARKAEEDARQAEEDARKAEEERIEAEARKAEEDARKAREAEAKKKAAAERKKEARRKANEEKQSKTAATALQQMAAGSSGGGGGGGGGGSMESMAAMMGNMSGPPANDEEAEMRAMFKKMREFNQKNPAMLAKLWEEERKQHAAQAPPGTAPPAQPVQTGLQPPAPKLTKNQDKAAATAPTLAPPTVPPPAQPTVPISRPNIALPTKNAQAPLSTSSQGASSLWPPHKKGSLAEAAARWLTTLPENVDSGKTISTEQVIKILDTNPSYVQLCEAVEKNGIRFERSALAKQLLKAVPDDLRGSQSGVKSGANAAPVTAANGTEPLFNGAGTPASAPPRKRGRPRGRFLPPEDRGSSSIVSYSTPSFTSPTDAAKGLNSINTGGGVFPGSVSGTISTGFTSQSATQDPTLYHADPMIIDDHPRPSGSQPPALKPEEKPPELPPPPPKDKEEAARKRGFGDLIDLTADDDSDDEPPPKKVILPSNAAPFSVKPVPSNDGFRQPISYQQFVSQKSHPSPGFPQNAVPARDLFPQQTWNRPQMQPAAPVHPPQIRPKGPSEEQKQAERIRGKMLVEPIMRDRVARKSKYDSRTIARDVLLATNRHPDMRPLNGHLNIMQKLLGDRGGVIDGAGNKSDLATIRWDLIDPGEPNEEAKLKSKKSEEVDDESDADSHAKLRSSTTERPGELRNSDRKQDGLPRQVPKADRDSSARDASPNILANEHPKLTSDLRSRASRGSSVARRESAASLHTPRAIVRRQKKPSSMSKSASSTPVVTGTPTGYAAFRPLDENGNPIKKKGRPVGWRKSVHSREAQGLTPYGVAGPKTTSKLRQSTGVRESSENVMPHYQVYPCKWKGCNSELDNLEKLKKHILKLHGEANSEGDYECSWGDCGTGDHIDANNNIRPGDEGVTSFETLDHWFKHVNKAHIQAIAWKLGDGPRGGSVAGEQE